ISTSVQPFGIEVGSDVGRQGRRGRDAPSDRQQGQKDCCQLGLDLTHSYAVFSPSRASAHQLPRAYTIIDVPGVAVRLSAWSELEHRGVERDEVGVGQLARARRDRSGNGLHLVGRGESMILITDFKHCACPMLVALTGLVSLAQTSEPPDRSTKMQ